MRSSQMPLFGDDADDPAPRTDALFFAIRPDAATADAIADLSARLRAQYHLKGKPESPGRLHVTLYYMGHVAGVPRQLVERAMAVLGNFRFPAFEISFDRVASFQGKSNRPVVLLCGGRSTLLHKFQGLLRAALVGAHFPEPRKLAFTPHVTLLRDHREVPEQAVAPVGWAVHEFLLIRSLQGRGVHQVLARFPLDG